MTCGDRDVVLVLCPGQIGTEVRAISSSSQKKAKKRELYKNSAVLVVHTRP